MINSVMVRGCGVSRRLGPQVSGDVYSQRRAYPHEWLPNEESSSHKADADDDGEALEMGCRQTVSWNGLHGL